MPSSLCLWLVDSHWRAWTFIVCLAEDLLYRVTFQTKTLPRGTADLDVCQVGLSEGNLCTAPVKMLGTLRGVLQPEAHSNHSSFFSPFSSAPQYISCASLSWHLLPAGLNCERSMTLGSLLGF